MKMWCLPKFKPLLPVFYFIISFPFSSASFDFAWNYLQFDEIFFWSNKVVFFAHEGHSFDKAAIFQHLYVPLLINY